MMWRADGMLPVKPILPTSAWVVSASPISDGRPVTTLMVPGGSASANMMTERMSASGQVSGGLSTTQLPASSAATIWVNARLTGEFHGTIDTTTP